MYIVNDGLNTLNMSIDLSEWADGVSVGTKIPVESAQDGFWGEISNLLTMPRANGKMDLFLGPYSTHRLTAHVGGQTEVWLNASLTCTARAGNNSELVGCQDDAVFVGTSNTDKHE